jgi:hypothetical protein
MATAAENSHSALFDFHSGFWINLHHFLYREAVVAAPQTGPRALAVNHDDADELNTLSAVEKVRGMRLSASIKNLWPLVICFLTMA